VRPEVDGKGALWNASLSGTQRYYAYKHFRSGEDDCASLSGYSAPTGLASAPVISDPIGREDGYYFLCVIAGDSASFDSTWQQPAHASMRFKRLDSQPPVVTLDYQINQLQDAYQLCSRPATGHPGWDSRWRREGRFRRRTAPIRAATALRSLYRISYGPVIIPPESA